MFYFDGIHVLDVLKTLCGIVTFIIQLSINFSFSLSSVRVDVFEHHRFCDEFSHLVKRLLLRVQVSVDVSLG